MDDLVKDIRSTLDDYKKQPMHSTTEFNVPFTSQFFTSKGNLSSSILRLLPGSRTLPSPFSPCIQPPVEVEKKFGLSGLSGQYRLPEGLTAHDLQSYTCVLDHLQWRGRISQDQQDGRMGELSAALIARNPSLEGLKFDMEDGRMHRYIVQGVASAFNPSDIQHFLDYRKTNAPEFIAPQLHKDIDRKLGIGELGWVPSMKTLQSMSQQISTPTPTALKATVAVSKPAVATTPKMSR